MSEKPRPISRKNSSIEGGRLEKRRGRVTADGEIIYEPEELQKTPGEGQDLGVEKEGALGDKNLVVDEDDFVRGLEETRGKSETEGAESKDNQPFAEKKTLDSINEFLKKHRSGYMDLHNEFLFLRKFGEILGTQQLRARWLDLLQKFSSDKKRFLEQVDDLGARGDDRVELWLKRYRKMDELIKKNLDLVEDKPLENSRENEQLPVWEASLHNFLREHRSKLERVRGLFELALEAYPKDLDNISSAEKKLLRRALLGEGRELLQLQQELRDAAQERGVLDKEGVVNLLNDCEDLIKTVKEKLLLLREPVERREQNERIEGKTPGGVREDGLEDGGLVKEDSKFLKKVSDLERIIEKVPLSRAQLPEGDFKKQREILQNFRDELYGAEFKLKQLLDYYSSDLYPKKHERLIGLRENLFDTHAKLGNLLAEVEKPPVNELSYEQLVDELKDSNWNPFFWKELKTERESRMKELITRFQNELMPEFRPSEEWEKEFDRVFQKVRLQLHFMDSDLALVSGEPTIDRAKLSETINKDYQVRRHELILCTTEHETLGPVIQEIFDDIRFTPAIPKGHVVVERIRYRDAKTGKFCWVPLDAKLPDSATEITKSRRLLKESEVEPGEEIRWKHDPELVFDDLWHEIGRENVLKPYIDKKYSDAPEIARWLAFKMFTVSDELSLVITQLQRRTKTKGYENNAEKDKDPVLMMDTLSALEHRAERYGWNHEDWVFWFTAFLEDIPITDKIGKPLKGESQTLAHKAVEEFLNRSLTQEEKNNWIKTVKSVLADGFWESDAGKKFKSAPKGQLKLYPSQLLRDVQKKVKAYIKAKYGGEGIIGEVPILGFGETYFPPLSSLFFLQDGEYIWKKPQDKEPGFYDRDDKAVDPAEAGKKRAETIASYYVAENAYAEILDTTFKGFGDQQRLSLKQITSQKAPGIQGGFLANFVKAWGRAKVFEGNHLNMLMHPMTNLLLARVVEHYAGSGAAQYEQLYRALMQGLRSTGAGGLSAFEGKNLDKVEAYITGDRRMYGVLNSKLLPWWRRNSYSQVKEYLDLWYTQKTGKEPPSTYSLPFWGLLAPTPNITLTGRSAEERVYLEALKMDIDPRTGRPKVYLPEPVSREGSLLPIEVEEEKKK